MPVFGVIEFAFNDAVVAKFMMDATKTNDVFMASVKGKGDLVMKIFDWFCAVRVSAVTACFVHDFALFGSWYVA